MSNPFGTSNQGGYQGPPTSTQAAPQQGFGGGAGYGGYGGFGGFQSQPSYGGFGGGFGGFNPMFGGLGGLGFNPMMGMGFMQPMPFFGGFGGGYGGGFGGFGGGFSPYQQPQFNPMFGGLGGLGFNPMMGGQFMQPMQKFDPYQQFQQPQDFGSLDMRYRGGPQMSPEMRQRREQDMRNMERMAQQPVQQPVDTSVDAFKNSQAYQDAMKNAFHGGGYQQDIGKSKYGFAGNGMQTGTLDRAYEDWKKSQPVQPAVATQSAMNMEEQARSLAKGPISGGLGFNPMMGPQFGMPTGENTGVKGIDPEQQYQQDLSQMQQQRAMNPGGRSIQDWQNEYNQLYPANRMTMNVAPSLEQFIQRRSNPISFPGMPGFTL